MLVALLLLAPAHAADDDRQTLRRIEDYLNDIRTMQARFTQYAENGGVATGTLYMQRPGRLRFEYTPPSPILIVATGSTVVFYDAELDQVSYVPLDATPLAFLLADEFSFDHEDIEVTRIERDPGALNVTLIDPENPGEGAVTLIFSDSPLALRQWRVLDAQGNTTTVALSDVRTGIEIDPERFDFDDPNPFRSSKPP